MKNDSKRMESLSKQRMIERGMTVVAGLEPALSPDGEARCVRARQYKAPAARRPVS